MRACGSCACWDARRCARAQWRGLFTRPQEARGATQANNLREAARTGRTPRDVHLHYVIANGQEVERWHRASGGELYVYWTPAANQRSVQRTRCNGLVDHNKDFEQRTQGGGYGGKLQCTLCYPVYAWVCDCVYVRYQEKNALEGGLQLFQHNPPSSSSSSVNK